MAHEKAKNLSHQSLKLRRPLAEIIEQDTEASVFWKKFTDSQRKIIITPEKHYTGLACKKSSLVNKYWKKRLDTKIAPHFRKG